MAGRRRRVAAPPPIEREHHYPAWYQRDRGRDVQHSTISLRSLVDGACRGDFRLPRFQRPYVWTDEQIVRLFDSLWRGYHVGSLILWERYGLHASVETFNDVSMACPAGRGAIVVDGQQRLGAIVSAALSDRFWFDMQEGVLTTRPGPWKMPASHALSRDEIVTRLHWYEEHAAQHRLEPDHVRDAWVAVIDTADNRHISCVRLQSEWDLPGVIESYRRLNTEGTPMAAAHLEDALRRAAEELGGHGLCP